MPSFAPAGDDAPDPKLERVPPLAEVVARAPPCLWCAFNQEPRAERRLTFVRLRLIVAGADCEPDSPTSRRTRGALSSSASRPSSWLSCATVLM